MVALPTLRHHPAPVAIVCIRCRARIAAGAYYCARCGLGVGSPLRLRRRLLTLFIAWFATAFTAGFVVCWLLFPV